MTEKSPARSRINVKELVRLSLLFALAIVLTFVEHMLPPIPALPPGVKLGLSNIVVMYSIFFINKTSTFTLLTLKSVFVFLTRGVIAGFMSASGGLFSVLVMLLLLRVRKGQLSYSLISVCGAVTHNMGQLAVSAFLLSSTLVFYYLPVLILSGVVMGLVTGTLLRVVLPALKAIGKNR